jgi:hypothetical protein
MSRYRVPEYCEEEEEDHHLGIKHHDSGTSGLMMYRLINGWKHGCTDQLFFCKQNHDNTRSDFRWERQLVHGNLTSAMLLDFAHYMAHACVSIHSSSHRPRKHYSVQFMQSV